MSNPQLRECSAQLWLKGAVTTLLTSESLSWHLHGVGLRKGKCEDGGRRAVAACGVSLANGQPQVPYRMATPLPWVKGASSFSSLGPARVFRSHEAL